MITFEKKVYKDGEPVVTEVEFESVESIRSFVEKEFWQGDAQEHSERFLENGKLIFQLIGKGGKILTEYKSKEPIKTAA